MYFRVEKEIFFGGGKFFFKVSEALRQTKTLKKSTKIHNKTLKKSTKYIITMLKKSTFRVITFLYFGGNYVF